MNFGRKIQIVFNRQKITNNSRSKPLYSLRDMHVSENQNNFSFFEPLNTLAELCRFLSHENDLNVAYFLANNFLAKI